jgi:hypothetical protein
MATNYAKLTFLLTASDSMSNVLFQNTKIQIFESNSQQHFWNTPYGVGSQHPPI